MARFIAEIGSNHNQDLQRTESLIRACAGAGAGAVKLQIFRIEDLFAPEVLAERPDLTARRAWEFPVELLEPVAACARGSALEIGATPFGLWAVDLLAPVVDFFKIASYELLWLDLIEACASTGRPLILSTGMATLDEIDAAVTCARKSGAADLTLLHCVSGYPTPPDQCNLAAIAALRERFGCNTGWSDHSADPVVVQRAIKRWDASDIELHVDLDGGGNEAGEHNWTPESLAETVAASRNGSGDPSGWQQMDGDGVKRPMPIEEHDVPWRADRSDGLRPLRATRSQFTRTP